jgi:hypothetical protein
MTDSNYYIQDVSVTRPEHAKISGTTRGLRTYFLDSDPHLFILKGGGKYYTIAYNAARAAQGDEPEHDELHAFIDFIKPFVVWDLFL